MDKGRFSNNRVALTDLWYGGELTEVTEKLESRVSSGLYKLVCRFPLLRSLMMLWVGRKDPMLMIGWGMSGRILTILCGVIGIRKLVILEFIEFNHERRHPLFSKAYALFVKYVLGPCARRSVLNIQVFTEWERKYIVDQYGLDQSRVRLFSWPLLLGEIKTRPLDEAPATPMVFSSGRAVCDWETLFAAFRLGDWPLTVACTASDLRRVKALNADNKATVFTDISKDEHDRLFASATVYALCLREEMKSSGQIRLASGIEAGVPIVAANVRGLDGYLVDGVTAVAYPPGDAQALSNAIGMLIQNPEKRKALVRTALQFARGNTREVYMGKITQMLVESKDEIMSVSSY